MKNTLDFYHSSPPLDSNMKKDFFYSRHYSIFKINQDNLDDIYHLITNLDDFLFRFDEICRPLDRNICLVNEIEDHQNKIFHKDDKPLFDLKNVQESLFFNSIICSHVKRIYPFLQKSELNTSVSTLRGVFDETYKEKKNRCHLNKNSKIDALLPLLKNKNLYRHLFHSMFIDVKDIKCDKNNTTIVLSTVGKNEISFSTKEIGSWLYGIMSEMHHNKIEDFNRLCADTYTTINRPYPSKWITYPLNVLFQFACIEFLRIAFGFLQEQLNHLDLQSLLENTEIEVENPLYDKLMYIPLSYRNLTNLYEKILCNSKVNLEKYIAELKEPFSLALS